METSQQYEAQTNETDSSEVDTSNSIEIAKVDTVLVKIKRGGDGRVVCLSGVDVEISNEELLKRVAKSFGEIDFRKIQVRLIGTKFITLCSRPNKTTIREHVQEFNPIDEIKGLLLPVSPIVSLKIRSMNDDRVIQLNDVTVEVSNEELLKMVAKVFDEPDYCKLQIRLIGMVNISLRGDLDVTTLQTHFEEHGLTTIKGILFSNVPISSVSYNNTQKCKTTNVKFESSGVIISGKDDKYVGKEATVSIKKHENSTIVKVSNVPIEITNDNLLQFVAKQFGETDYRKSQLRLRGKKYISLNCDEDSFQSRSNATTLRGIVDEKGFEKEIKAIYYSHDHH